MRAVLKSFLKARARYRIVVWAAFPFASASRETRESRQQTQSGSSGLRLGEWTAASHFAVFRFGYKAVN